ncbi:hypothetical protein HPB48_008712 [Haemaphysalis longicornis]|uniref:CCHC-type domain-containing protein n=1 Tax=Haemaphysalis longicornis TaxID=44386 RepID=A0A9J6GAG6_HAELO|nr:hypothetical protein HPB48_008712 [Haemaphysalis longicornis]
MQQDAELTALNGKIAEATDDEALEQELEGAAEYNRKVSYAIYRARFLLRNAQPNAPVASKSGIAAASAHDLTTRGFVQNADLSPPGKSETPVPSAVALTAETESPATPACPLCDSRDHKVADCRVNLSAAEKRRGCAALVAAFDAADTNITCNGRHLTVLCDLLRPADPTTPTSTPQVQAGQGALPTVVTASSGNSGETSVLLPTARAWAEVDPVRHELWVKLHWVAFSVTNETIRKIFAEYGDVKEVTSGVFRTLRAPFRQPGLLPHQLRLGSGTELVALPGRAPLCHRCRRAGHIRQECRAPRCSECHAFGHEKANCTRSYARAVGRGLESDNSELVMDEDEAEGAAEPAAPEPKTHHPEPETDADTTRKDDSKPLTAEGRAAPTADPPRQATAHEGDSAGTTKDGSERMDLEVQPSNRRHEDGPETADESNQRKPQRPWQAGRGKKNQGAATTKPKVALPGKGGTKIT